MTHIHSVLLILHIILGSLAIIIFWVPMFTKKGQLNHVKYGNYYTKIMYGVAASGAIMAIMVIAAPLAIKQQYASHEHAAQIATNLRVFWSFLLYLALLSYTSTRQGFAVLQAKENRQSLRTITHAGPIALLFVGGIVLTSIGIAHSNTLHIVFGLLGTAVALGSLKYIFAKSVSRKQYIIEHIGNMLGSAIGAYTAFISFGGRHLLEGAGDYQIVFWIAPGVIGGFATFILTKKYCRVFGIKS